MGSVFGTGVGWGEIRDDFNDGDDVGWTRLVPLGELGGTSTFSFPGGETYRIQAGASPNPSAFGQSRVGSFREDASFSAFRVAVDLVDTGGGLEQDLGILARVRSPGLQTLDGYAATLDTDESRIYLSRIDNEQPDVLGSEEVILPTDEAFRLVFHGYRDRFLVEVFALSDLLTPLAILEGQDEGYDEGMVGLFGNAGQPSGRVDGTFDRFVVDDRPDVDRDAMPDPEEWAAFGSLEEDGEDDFDGDGWSNARELREGTDPTVKDAPVELSDFEVTVTSVRLEFLTQEGELYQLESSPDLVDWTVETTAEFRVEGGGRASLETGRGGAKRFYRVIVPE